MWRQSSFLANTDSDHSLSEEEDSVSLGEAVEKTDEFHLLSQLDILKGNNGPNHEREIGNLLCKGKGMVSDFLSTHSAEKLNRRYFPAFGSKTHDGSFKWSTISKEAEALAHPNERIPFSSSNSKASSLCRGTKGNAKQKFSFHFQTRQREVSHCSMSRDKKYHLSKVDELPNNYEAVDLLACATEDFVGEKVKNQLDTVPVDGEPIGQGIFCTSMTELLDGLQDKTSLLRGNPKLYNRARGKRVWGAKKSVLSLRERTIESEDDPPKSIDRDSPSDCDDNDQNLKLAIPWMGGQTITDKFEVAIGDGTCMDVERDPVTVPKTFRTGLLGKLQQVMQSEKQREIDFLNKLPVEPGCIDVKILERYFEAKLVVCCCSVGENMKRSPLQHNNPINMENGGRKRTIIFSPRVCGNVELDVGNFIRVHSPWKEVHISNGEGIILSTYFSKISSHQN